MPTLSPSKLTVRTVDIPADAPPVKGPPLAAKPARLTCSILACPHPAAWHVRSPIFTGPACMHHIGTMQRGIGWSERYLLSFILAPGGAS